MENTIIYRIKISQPHRNKPEYFLSLIHYWDPTAVLHTLNSKDQKVINKVASHAQVYIVNVYSFDSNNNIATSF